MPSPLAGGSAVVDGCGKSQNSAELAAEEYTLMSIDTIVNGKVGALCSVPRRSHPGQAADDVSSSL